MEKRWLNTIWNWDAAAPQFDGIRTFKWVTACIFITAIVYPTGTVLLGLEPQLYAFRLQEFWNSIIEVPAHKDWKDLLPRIWFGLAIICVVVRISVIIDSYFKSIKVIGKQQFSRNFYTYYLSFALALGTTLLLGWLINRVLIWFGVGFKLDNASIEFFFHRLQYWIDLHIPSLLHINHYGLALITTIFIAALPGYFMHWICHRSRFFWYVCHRAHHCPDFLHPLVAPDAFNFALPLIFLKGISAIIISKLVYTEPMVMEMAIWYTLSNIAEIFNHSIVHYDFALKNPFVRNYCRLFGEFGVYHLMHHSSKPEDHTINLSGAPFLIWDRLFGTYRKPYDTVPPIGLSNNPDIHMNPLRVTFSGMAQLWYEWKYNRDWVTRFNILFGSIWYKPPVTKDFLLKPVQQLHHSQDTNS